MRLWRGGGKCPVEVSSGGTKQRAGRASQLPWAAVPRFVGRAVFRALVVVTWEHYCSTDIPSLCFAAVALKNHGANEAERDGDRDGSSAPGTAAAAVPEGELLLQVSGALQPPPPGRCIQGCFPLIPFPAPSSFPKKQAALSLIPGHFGEACGEVGGRELSGS